METGENKKTEKTPNAFLPFILAPVPPAILFILVNFGDWKSGLFPKIFHEWVQHVSQLSILALMIVLIAWALILFFAMPLYFIMKASGCLRPLYIILIAGTITIIPDLFLEFSRMDDDSTGSHFYHGCRAVINDVRTPCGWKLFFQMLSGHFAYGCLAGYIFCGLYFKKWIF